ARSMNAVERPSKQIEMLAVVGESAERRADKLAVEEPLEIRLAFGPVGGRSEQSVSITMRTPGHDAELAAGFLFGEGIVAASREIETIRHCGPPSDAGSFNAVRLELRADVAVDFQRLERHFYTTSSCGVCGKSSLDALEVKAAPLGTAERFRIAAAAIHELPTKLRQSQAVFERTGGLHAAALFDAAGQLAEIREDVGRHNAVDKLVGSRILAGQIPIADRGLLVSGRASFELMQKAIVAGIPLLAAVGAPSSLAVELARRFGATLIGFLRDERFNIYSGDERIELAR
ncbi:MAG TPA: formate dehydrogenase accessory sulfurtransferase FdhD, partial [Pirellulales bacterium]